MYNQDIGFGEHSDTNFLSERKIKTLYISCDYVLEKLNIIGKKSPIQSIVLVGSFQNLTS